MEEQLVQKAIEAITTAAKMAGGEAPKVAAEFLNYMLFCGILSIIQSLAWGLIILFIYKVGNMFIKAYTNEYEETKEKYKNPKSDVLKRDVDQAWGSVAVSKFFTWGLVTILSLYLTIQTSEHFKVIGKVLLAPRVLLVESGANLIKKVEEKSK